jgi:hypothetical protein
MQCRSLEAAGHGRQRGGAANFKQGIVTGFTEICKLVRSLRRRDHRQAAAWRFLGASILEL